MGHENGKGKEVEDGEIVRGRERGRERRRGDKMGKGRTGKVKRGTAKDEGGWLGRKLSFSPLSGNSLLSHEPQRHGATKLLLRIFRR